MQRETRRAFNQYMYKTIHNPYVYGKRKMFYKYIKSLRSDHTGIPSLERNGQSYTTSQEKARILNEYFCTVFTPDRNDEDLPTIGDSPFSSISKINLQASGITKLLKDLDPSKAAGPDHIPAKFLKMFAEDLTPCLFILFSASLKQGIIPTDWKKATVSPIFKKGSRSDPANYRPISLTSLLCKTLEHIIYSHVMGYLERNNILSTNQFGFRQKRSADLQLLLTVHDLASSLNDNAQTDCILLDFSKAFDKVSHKLLLLKLRYYGITGETINWIQSFLTNRKQQVVCDGSISEVVNVTSGVPQGSVLGPLLFLVFINDLPSCIKSTCRLFADDCLLYRQIHSKHDSDVLQNDLHCLEHWANKWFMQFNPIKCVVLTITHKVHPTVTHYTLYDQMLAHVQEAKYLGLTLDSKLTFNKHIECICKRANSALAFIRRNTHFCQRNIRADAYCTYVRPILEYAAFVWSPYTNININKLESVQRRAARYVMSDFNRYSSVGEMLSTLQWDSLKKRRDIQSLCVLYKILNGLIDVSLPECMIKNSLITRGHNKRFVTISSTVNSYKYSFFPRVVPQWNALPSVTVNAPTLQQFSTLVH